MDQTRAVLEIVYFVTAGLILVIIAAIGLWQLKIAKSTARMSAKRDAFQLTANQCAQYATDIIPMLNSLDQEIANQNMRFSKDSKVNVEGKEIKIVFANDKKSLTEFVLLNKFLSCINRLEGFAVFFTSGVACEEIAFSSVGQTYCNTVRGLLPGIMLLGGGKTHFINTIKLFLLWNSRIDSLKLLEKKLEIEAKIASLDGHPIRPIGAD